ncbi:FHA domain-containing protein [Frigoribacterium sp. 2-23]|uniref:FHA domain-containing protein n=1 Tax=Frigoribacterium sp. 2-23 TaxID=3415006 RepID=UPI003C6FAC32
MQADDAPKEGDTATIMPVERRGSDGESRRPGSNDEPRVNDSIVVPDGSSEDVPSSVASPADLLPVVPPTVADTARADGADQGASNTEADRPVPLVEPGTQRLVERCTSCGAEVGEDDIFCGECGAVVQSVALSFTGPVTPLPPEWRPETPAPDSPAPDSSTPGSSSSSSSSSGPSASERSSESSDKTPDVPTPVEPSAPVDPPVAPRHASEPARGETPAAERRPVPSDEPIRSVPGVTGVAAGSSDGVPVAPVAPMPPSPPRAWGAGLGTPVKAQDDDVDETRIVRRAPVGVSYGLQFSTGESVTVDGTGLVGRAPTAQPGERFDLLVRIVDPGKSVSKTHLEFGQENGSLWISDRWSGNGTVVRDQQHGVRRVEPGTRVHVTRGSRVEIGEQFIIVT